ncbi:MAG: hypothetical protein ACO3ME_06595, partial [Ilumatobacteraceae bacterium]
CARHPLMRALRPGHHALVPLQQVLMSYLNRTAADDILFWKMASTSPNDLAARAERVVVQAGRGEVWESRQWWEPGLPQRRRCRHVPSSCRVIDRANFARHFRFR